MAKRLIIALASILAASFILVVPQAALAEAKCYMQTASGVVEKIPSCNRGPFEAAGFNVDGLPDPFDANSCYFWTNDSTAPGQKVDCSLPQLTGAAPIDSAPPVQASTDNIGSANNGGNPVKYGYQQGTAELCGGGDQAVAISIHIGCVGKGNPILDALFAIVRFLSTGVGIVLVGSIIVAGIQYTMSRGNPQETAKSVERIINTAIALLLFVFAYALLNWLIPAGVLK